ncbi:GDP-mannose 4,6-dehydratase [Pseudomonas sp. N040]|uniref:GDP-mannose 4,6-dehydratase n=1 Tax=Pseudomonas sp. N040 TaxID=2785325 RepID=UPI0018A2BB21|nr:GDP-mannose 4,6-dehydratase [Pseudomonas sp. N040]MBF7728998.1 GDP-mannose 4,6-dehydratase [Pseudomonas sp. N040]MBW7012638.1 GDP-mannose 4,6-dehydratase [Pseudomonas sp. N040]
MIEQGSARTLLVTGLGGFVGGHLRAALAARPGWRLLPAQPHDLLERASLDAWLALGVPDAVIHLAGQTFVPESFRDPQHTFSVNLLGTLNLLQALKAAGFTGTFLFVSSGDVYGQVAEDDLPIRETLPPRPRNPYAVSKVAAELLCQQWSYVEPWRIIIARPFNHIGAGQAEGFVIPSMARQLVRVRRGLQAPCLEVGDVDVSRDFLDVGDVIGAYFSLLEHGQNGAVYNVCSGQERRVRDLILQMAELAGVRVELVQDAARLRRAEQRRVVGCADKLREAGGWEPALSITETLRRVLSDWEARETEHV